MKACKSFYFIAALTLVFASAWLHARPVYDEMVVAGFYPYQKDYVLKPENIDTGNITHLIYTFAGPRADGSISTDTGSYHSMAAPLVSRLHEDGKKFIVMMGGGLQSGGFHGMASSQVTRTVFINTLSDWMRNYGYDGVNLDWEYPGDNDRDEDRANLTALVIEMRQAFDALEMELGKDLEISMDVHSSLYYAEWVDFATLKNYIDWFGLMSYDYAGNWPYAIHAAHNAPLYCGPAEICERYLTVDLGVKNLREELNIPASQIVMGVAFYGREFFNSALYETPREGGGGITYTDIEPLIGKGWERLWDSQSLVPYLRKTSGTGIISYDDEESLTVKADYIKQNGLLGAMIWEITQDVNKTTGAQPLFDTIGTNLVGVPFGGGSNSSRTSSSSSSKFSSLSSSSAVNICNDLPVWSAATVYNSGNQVQYSGGRYTANYWTQGNNPATRNGAGEPWTRSGSCGGVASSSISSSSLSSSVSLSSSSNASVRDDSFRVVGYMPSWKGLSALVDNTDLSLLTHINAAFLNPSAAGVVAIGDNPVCMDATGADIDYLVSRAHQAGVKVLVSVAGGVLPPCAGDWAQLLQPANRIQLVNNLVSFINQHNLDGIDIDIEGGTLTHIHNAGNYVPFIQELRTQLNPLGKLVTSATASYYGGMIPVESIPYFDFVNVMSYDAVGPWTGATGGEHSTYNQAAEHINFWRNRGLPQDKLVLGVPFYGWGFGTYEGDWSYQDIINSFGISAAQGDVIGSLCNGCSYITYNGVATIRAKTSLALQQASGVMIWELSHDIPGSLSLLNTINDEIGGDSSSSSSLSSTSSSSSISSSSSSSVSSSSSLSSSSRSSSSSSTGGGSCTNVPQYVNGNSYSSGDLVKNYNEQFRCNNSGLCSEGGIYTPGNGWAWPNAWQWVATCSA